MNGFMYKLSKFFQGRYGIDKIFYALFGVDILLSVVNLFARSWIIQIVCYACIVYALYRALSRNTQKRYAENQKFEQLFSGVISKYKKAKFVHEDKKTHIYYKCPSCKKTLRLPKLKGEHSGTCPVCGQKFRMKI